MAEDPSPGVCDKHSTHTKLSGEFLTQPLCDVIGVGFSDSDKNDAPGFFQHVLNVNDYWPILLLVDNIYSN